MLSIPLKIAAFLHRIRYLHYFAVGVSGVALNLGITVVLTELVFGRERYFSAYVIGLAAGLLYNFTLHTIVTFKTKDRHTSRLLFFLAYSLTLTYVQARVVKAITDTVGVDWYALVIATVILTFSVLTFIVFKLFVFRNRPVEADNGNQTPASDV